ncbi:MAG: aminotransferase class I/II-fold pyridoxal phosphate-dependent enzyme [Propionibacteriaceae bacterium]|jgi:cystathionine gamma-synthase|nr:aminotransferase class I/II-fold pyridoxal phosphate-dependent enzyme [Propionibacteriaceae bacterium]
MPEFSTRAIHVGQEPDPITGAVVPPVTFASTYVMDQVGVPRGGYDYSRSGNPTRDGYQAALASLEEGESALAFPSGLSATDTVLRALVQPGERVLYSQDVYGGTYRMFNQLLPAECRLAHGLDATDTVALANAAGELRPRVVWLETPSNPLLDIIDIESAAAIAHAVGAFLVVDNTFATPALQRPLTLGADVVVHSTTKAIGGHSDLVGGAAVFAPGLELGRPGASETGLVAAEAYWWQNATGAIPSPFDCWLGQRGLKTLDARVRAACANAQIIAEFLETVPQVTRVRYPGLPNDPGHQTAVEQMDGFGAVVSFQVGSAQAAKAICEATKVFLLAVSLGAVESLIEYPAAMTHPQKSGSAAAIPADLVRLAVGLEDSDDLIADLRQAFAAAAK